MAARETGNLHIFDVTRMSPGSQGQGGIRIAVLTAALHVAQLRPLKVIARPEQVDWLARDLRELSSNQVSPQIVTANGIEEAVGVYGADAIWWDLLNGRTKGARGLTSVSLVADLLFKDHPGFFETSEIQAREAEYGDTIREASILLTLSRRQVERIKHWYGRMDATALHFPPGLTDEFPGAIDRSSGPAGVSPVAPPRTWIFPAVGWPHKNHLRLVQAFLLACTSPDFPNDIELVLSAQPSRERSATDWQSLASTSSRIRTVPYMTDAEFQGFLRSADAVVYPSLHEGYGLPPLEALALGIPVLTSAVPAIDDLPDEWEFTRPTHFTDVSSISAMARDMISFANRPLSDWIKTGADNGLVGKLRDRFLSELEGVIAAAESHFDQVKERKGPRRGTENARTWTFAHLRPGLLETTCDAGHRDVEFLASEPDDDFRSLMNLVFHAETRFIGVRLGPWTSFPADLTRRCENVLLSRHVADSIVLVPDELGDGAWLVIDRDWSQRVLAGCHSIRDLRDSALRLSGDHEWTFVYIDSGLKEANGHHLEMAERMCAAANAGGATSVAIVPAGSSAQLKDTQVRTGLHEFSSSWSSQSSDPGLFAWQLDQMTADLGLTSRDVMYMPSASPTMFLGSIGWLLRRAASQMPYLVVTIDRAASAYPSSAYDYVDCATAMRRHGLDALIEVRVESLQLHEYLSTCGFTKVLLRSCPLPETAPNRRNREEVRLVFPGNAREEKGFDLIPDVLGDLLRDETLSPFEAVVQIDVNGANASGSVLHAASTLRRIAEVHAAVKVVGRLSSPEYASLINGADIAVLPYRRDDYSARGSGVAAEAIKAGTWVVTFPNNDVAETYAGRCLSVAETETPASLAAVLRETIARVHRGEGGHCETVLESGVVLQSARESVEEILDNRDSVALRKAKGEPRMALVIVNNTKRQGNSAVFASQVGGLTRLGYRVIVLELPFPSRDAFSEQDDFNLGRFLVSGHIRGRYRNAERLEQLISRVAVEGPTLDFFTQSAGAVEWPAWLLEAIANVEAPLVLVNYVFNHPTIRQLGLPPQATLLAETHDINEVQFALLGSREPLGIRVDAELKLMDRHFDHILSISDSERALIADHVSPLRVTHVLPSLDFDSRLPSELPIGRFHVVGAERAAMEAAQAQLTTITGTHDLLFMGSDHPANVASLNWFLDGVFYPFLQSRGISLLIAGRVGAKASLGSHRGIHVAGEIRDIDEAFLRTKCSVLPIRTGTGVPIKILETWRNAHPFSMTDFPVAALGLTNELPHVRNAAEMASDLVELLGSESAARARGQLGRRLYEQLCSESRYAELIAQVVSAADDVARGRGSQRAEM